LLDELEAAEVPAWVFSRVSSAIESELFFLGMIAGNI